jgi:hypothetical protein
MVDQPLPDGWRDKKESPRTVPVGTVSKPVNSETRREMDKALEAEILDLVAEAIWLEVAAKEE